MRRLTDAQASFQSASACRECIYWRAAVRAPWQAFDASGRTVQVDHAQCRRRAPLGRADRHRDIAEGYWPETNATDWCGDFEPSRAALAPTTPEGRTDRA